MPTDAARCGPADDADDADALADAATSRPARRPYPAMPPAVHTDRRGPRLVAPARLADGEPRSGWPRSPGDGGCGFALLRPTTWLRSTCTSRPARAGRGHRLRAARPGQGAAARTASACGSSRQRRPGRFYRRHGLVELERTDGSANEERAARHPDGLARRRTRWATCAGRSTRSTTELADLLARRAALDRGRSSALKEVPGTPGATRRARREIVARMAAPRARRWARSGWRRIMHAVITESLDAAEHAVITRRGRSATCVGASLPAIDRSRSA